MIRLNFFELVDSVNNCTDRNEFSFLADSIDIDGENFNLWVDSVFSDNIDSFDMGKLPFLIDELYKSDDNFKFMLCCMLLEAACDKLFFVTNLEDYSLSYEKFKVIANTLVTIYDIVDNEVANCMALIIVNSDPKFEFFDDEQKQVLIEATRRKLHAIYKYLKTDEINPDVFMDLEIIVDLACYMNDNEINRTVDFIDKLGFNDVADMFIIKYKIINGFDISNDKINYVIDLDEGNLCILYEIMEDASIADKYLSNISQEMIAKSNMIRWLQYPTELGSTPDKIELLGEILLNNDRFFVYKFLKSSFKIKDWMVGISGGFVANSISSKNSGYTFSKFEVVGDWESQARDIISLISDSYKKHFDEAN